MMIEIADNSTNILDPPAYDDSIESDEYYNYTPQSQNNLDTVGVPIQIDINASDSYFCPSKSYIVIKGQLVRNDNDNAYDANAQITLINNAMMHLFSDCRYSINDTIIETISNPGQTTSMLGYLTYAKSIGSNFCWVIDTSNNADGNEFLSSQAVPAAGYRPAKNPNYNKGFSKRHALLTSANPRGSFSFFIPFQHIFGFAQYDKILFNVKHSLSLTRKTSDNNAIHRTAGVPDGKIKLTNIVWKIPKVKLGTTKLMELRQIIKDNKPIPIAFSARTSTSTSVPDNAVQFDWRISVKSGVEKPRWIVVGFQTNKHTNQEQNPSVFDHVNLTNAYVTLNGDKYPTHDLITNFASNDYSVLYGMFNRFKTEYYGGDEGSQISNVLFKTLFPIIVFDVRRQSEQLKSGVVDIVLRFSFSQGVPDNTLAYATILSDRLYKLTPDGQNLTMLSY